MIKVRIRSEKVMALVIYKFKIQISLDYSEKSYIDKSLHNMLLSIHLSSSGQYIWNNTTTSVRYNIFKSFLVRWPSFKGLCQWQSTKILVIYHKTTFCLVPLRPFASANTHFPLVGTTLIGYRLDDNFLTFFVWKVQIKDILKLNYSKKGICWVSFCYIATRIIGKPHNNKTP